MLTMVTTGQTSPIPTMSFHTLFQDGVGDIVSVKYSQYLRLRITSRGSREQMFPTQLLIMKVQTMNRVKEWKESPARSLHEFNVSIPLGPSSGQTGNIFIKLLWHWVSVQALHSVHSRDLQV